MSNPIIHLRCGHDIQQALQDAGLDQRFVSWADPLCEGPCPGHLTDAERRSLRARWLADRLGRPETEIAERMAFQDRDLESAMQNAGELVLWFEHDLFDQTILVYLLCRLRAVRDAGCTVSMICIGHHASIDRFRGLGQLAPAHLPALFKARQPVADAAFDLAERAWAAYTAPTPEAILALVSSESPALPFLPAALTRHLQQFPWRADGLALTEWFALDVIDLGAEAPEDIFRHVQGREDAPWQGDSMFYPWLRDLCRGEHPLLAIEDEGTRLQLTARGRSVLLGGAEALDGRPLDRWLGGVHLTGSQPAWRWDANANTLIYAPEGTVLG